MTTYRWKPYHEALPFDNVLTKAYAGWADELVEIRGYEPYLLTFMFRPLSGSPAGVARQMELEVERVYYTLSTRIVRHPRRKSSEGRLPIWLGCHDRPVYKQARQTLRDIVPNDGRHMHVVALQPPWSRLHEDLVTYFAREHATYVHPHDALDRLHVQAITDRVGNVVDYVRKQVGRDPAGEDITLILPRARSELT